MNKLLLIFVLIVGIIMSGCIDEEVSNIISDTKPTPEPTQIQTPEPEQQLYTQRVESILGKDDFPGFKLNKHEKEYVPKSTFCTVKTAEDCGKSSTIYTKYMPIGNKHYSSHLKYSDNYGRSIIAIHVILDSNESLEEYIDATVETSFQNIQYKVGEADIGDYSVWSEGVSEDTPDVYVSASSITFSAGNNFVWIFVVDETENGHALAERVARKIEGRLR